VFNYSTQCDLCVVKLVILMRYRILSYSDNYAYSWSVDLRGVKRMKIELYEQ